MQSMEPAVRYFFHVVLQDHEATDDWGVIFATAAEAFVEAERAAREQLANAIRVATMPPISVHVMNADGLDITTVRLDSLLPIGWR